ncbi:hypothetical protein BOSEA31B_11692 [Hyphomicrobiales bacterium]|nr:hypothetical protein BOSEA31B_11692 [Hyphomicrobiales bacterium]CAH1697485.1 hypothetical protein BOSEA1005_10522 [Hyphomicrobiales bacterium]CAI0345673.1 hypothetical protein BO1005MUT1_30188 [Hyphomicrobiales bacterium]
MRCRSVGGSPTGGMFSSAPGSRSASQASREHQPWSRSQSMPTTAPLARPFPYVTLIQVGGAGRGWQGSLLLKFYQ